MLKSLYSGISGMKVNQTKLDVVGNNIANVGTTSFKAQRVRFQDMMSQNLKGAMSPSSSLGGTNPQQVGLGVQMGGIDTIDSTGSMQPTGRPLDVAIDGEGYFLVAKGPTVFDDKTITEDNATNSIKTSGNMDIMYSRDGAFSLDSEGNLLTSDGYRVLGYSLCNADAAYGNSNTLKGAKSGSIIAADTTAIGTGSTDAKAGDLMYVDAKQPVFAVSSGEDIDNSGSGTAALRTLRIPDAVIDPTTGEKLRIQTFSIEKDGVIKAVLSGGKVAAIGQIATASFKNPGALESLGKNLYTQSVNSGDANLRSWSGSTDIAKNVAATKITDNGNAYGDMLQNTLEMSNVDLAEQFTDMIVASRAFQANSKTITTGDEILQDIINIKR